MCAQGQENRGALRAEGKLLHLGFGEALGSCGAVQYDITGYRAVGKLWWIRRFVTLLDGFFSDIVLPCVQKAGQRMHYPPREYQNWSETMIARLARVYVLCLFALELLLFILSLLLHASVTCHVALKS